MSHERELIAAIIADHRQLDVASAIVRDRDFLDPVNRRVWRALHVLTENRVPLNDIAAIKDTLKNAGLSIADIARLVGSGISAHTEHYAKSVRDTARRLRCAERLMGAAKTLGNDGADTDAVLDEIESICADERLETEAGIISIGDAAKALVAELRNPPSAAICFSGLWSLDEKVGGFRAGETIVLAARPGIGKSSLAMQFALNNAKKQRTGLFISLEMVHRELVGRVLCGASEVDGTRIRNREATKDEIDRIESAAKELDSLGVYIWDPSFARLGDIVSRARLAKVKNGIQWLVVDYIGLIAGSKKSNDDARRLHIGQCSRTLKALAKELEIPIFILSQLNREADKGGPPMLSHLKECGDIEQDADAVIFIHEQKGDYQLIVAKHRHGRRGFVDVDFDGPKTKFFDPNTIKVGGNPHYPTAEVETAGTKWIT